MDAKQALAFYQEYLEVIYNQHRIKEFERFCTPDVVAHPPLPGKEPGLPGLVSALEDWFTAFPDLRINLDGLIYADGILASRITITATNTGPFMGVPPTGRQIKIVDHPHYRLRDGKISEIWDIPELPLIMVSQLGLLQVFKMGA